MKRSRSNSAAAPHPMTRLRLGLCCQFAGHGITITLTRVIFRTRGRIARSRSKLKRRPKLAVLKLLADLKRLGLTKFP